MGDVRDNEVYEEELLDYEEEDEKLLDSATKVNGDAVKKYVCFSLFSICFMRILATSEIKKDSLVVCL